MEATPDPAGSTAEPESGWGVSLQGGGQGAGLPSVAYAGQGCGQPLAALLAVSYWWHGGGQSLTGCAGVVCGG